MNLSFDFEALMHLEGAAFTLKRDAWLTEFPGARKEVERNLRSRNWRVRATAVILQGYMDARPTCVAILDLLRTHDLNTFPMEHVLSQEDYFERFHEAHLKSAGFLSCAPAVGYESLLKRRGEWASPWRDVLLVAIPQDEIGLDALIYAIERTPKSEREAIAHTLLRFPRAMVMRKWRAERAGIDDLAASIEAEVGITVLPKRDPHTYPSRDFP